MNDLRYADPKFRFVYFFVVLISLLIFSSCEKVVYIDLNTSDPRPVIEANITNQAGPYTVRLHHSVNYYDPNTFPAITDAVVTISDNTGISEILQQTSDGIYQTNTLQGIPGRTYTLKIMYNGKEYDAVSTMPDPVAIDSVQIVQNKPEGGGNNHPGFHVTTYFTDPFILGNYYRLHLISNDTNAVDKKRYRYLSDKLTDGMEMSLSYNTNLLYNDSLTVTLESIDKSTYDFFTTLRDVVGGESSFLSAPPANPVNNISKGGLGYFASYSVIEKSYIVR